MTPLSILRKVLFFSGIVEAMVSVRRVQAFLLQSELKPSWAYGWPSAHLPNNSTLREKRALDFPNGISNKWQAYTLSQARPPLDDLELLQPLLASQETVVLQKGPAPGPFTRASMPALLPMYPDCAAVVSEVTCSWTSGPVKVADFWHSSVFYAWKGFDAQ